jgi:hypothetical protein
MPGRPFSKWNHSEAAMTSDTNKTETPEAGHMTQDPRQDAGQDRSIEKRLKKDPQNEDAQLDRGLDESMDASDPPSAAQPGTSAEPPKSSGFDEEAEAKRQE